MKLHFLLNSLKRQIQLGCIAIHFLLRWHFALCGNLKDLCQRKIRSENGRAKCGCFTIPSNLCDKCKEYRQFSFAECGAIDRLCDLITDTSSSSNRENTFTIMHLQLSWFVFVVMFKNGCYCVTKIVGFPKQKAFLTRTYAIKLM